MLNGYFADEYATAAADSPAEKYLEVLGSNLDSGIRTLELAAKDSNEPPVKAHRRLQA